VTNRKFNHVFTPLGSGTSGIDPIELSTIEIAQAAISEISQLSLPAVPFNLFLEQLLVSGDDWFRWISPLGQIRETKVALSGLFGRFVARAYLSRYFKFTYFDPIKSNTQNLSGWPAFKVERKPAHPGDLPDWVVATKVAANSIAIAEAKGSHNISGFQASLDAAMKQVQRVDILSNGVALAIKRYAVAARWAVQNYQGLEMPWLAVDDPQEGQRDPSDEEIGLLIRSTRLGHFSALVEGFGAGETAGILRGAKMSRPGQLQLPVAEQVQIERPHSGAKSVIGAIITPFGVRSLPRDGDLENYRLSLIAAYGDRSMLLVIDVDTLKNASLIVDDEATTKVTPIFQGDSIWAEEHVNIDGSELIPLHSVVLKRSSLLDGDVL
jgi:hypothetical protein